MDGEFCTYVCPVRIARHKIVEIMNLKRVVAPAAAAFCL